MNISFSNILWVAAGSGFGGMTRYIISRIMQTLFPGSFPWGTFIVNVLGCFILGLIYGFIEKGFHLTDGLKLFLTIGFCGGFTTFSTFINENFQLLEQELTAQFLLYSISSFVSGLLLIYAGYQIARII
ncbi:MAG: fluoride efflux transporter CrcB [Duncaniella sp.]|nr:fluoride efflux transporter CrcB [Duncaniella sp.]